VITYEILRVEYAKLLMLSTHITNTHTCPCALSCSRNTQVYTQESEGFTGSDTPMGRFIEYAKCDEQWAVDKIAAITEYAANMCDKDTVEDFKSTADKLKSKQDSTTSSK
jgi:hypothetical protein